MALFAWGEFGWKFFVSLLPPLSLLFLNNFINFSSASMFDMKSIFVDSSSAINYSNASALHRTYYDGLSSLVPFDHDRLLSEMIDDFYR